MAARKQAQIQYQAVGMRDADRLETLNQYAKIEDQRWPIIAGNILYCDLEKFGMSHDIDSTMTSKRVTLYQ